MTSALPEPTISSQIPAVQFRLKHLLGAVAVASLVLAALVWFLRLSQSNFKFERSKENLQNIVLAIQNYHDFFGCFPAVSITDSRGRPAHSWRIAIAPFLEKKVPLAGYDFSEPWDGPTNSQLGKYMPNCFRGPGSGAGNAQLTSYVAIAGPDTMWPGPNIWLRMSDVVDGASETILVLEIANSDIHWMEPRDLAIANLGKLLDPSNKPSLLNTHRRSGVQGGLVVFADGHTEFLPQSQAEEQLRKLLARGDRLLSPTDY